LPSARPSASATGVADVGAISPAASTLAGPVPWSRTRPPMNTTATTPTIAVINRTGDPRRVAVVLACRVAAVPLARSAARRSRRV
jgi:hypothetical protein